VRGRREPDEFGHPELTGEPGGDIGHLNGPGHRLSLAQHDDQAVPVLPGAADPRAE
jgi:hypothetical protein